MSYLALNPSPINENENDGMYKKPQLRNTNNNKTIKKKPQKIAPNVQNIMQTIGYGAGNQNYDAMNDDMNDEPADFNPPDYAEMTKVPASIPNSFSPLVNSSPDDNVSKLANNVPVTKEPFKGLLYSTIPNNTSYENNDVYTKPFVPYYNNQMNAENKNQDPLLEKLNYMILLLEEQQNERTEHIMEELILYFFLGIFMIFMVDSFARSGKYVR
jgi:hypothetical protein